jgi:hypothetical protein
MADERIKRKNLWVGMDTVKQTDWIKAASKLKNVALERNSGGTSHTVILRDPKKLNNDSTVSLITIIPRNLYKELNRAIFKQILAYGEKNDITEDDIWRGLKRLK